MDKNPIEQQINRISTFYNIEVIDSDKGVIGVHLHDKLFITMFLEKYPKKPIIKIPKAFQKIAGKPNNFLETLSDWNSKENPEILDVLNEFSNFIAIHGSGTVKISIDLMLGILKWASDHGREILAMLRTEKGVISEFILPPGMQSNEFSAIFRSGGLAIDKSIIGTVHSHPSGNLNPSMGDKAIFSRYKLNFIVGPPFNLRNVRCYNHEGKSVLFEYI